MKIKLMSLGALLILGSFTYANDLNIEQNIFNDRVVLDQHSVSMKSYTGKWKTNCVFDEAQKKYFNISFEFEHPFLLKKTTTLFKNHICTVPSTSKSYSYQINHVDRNNDGYYALYSSLPERIDLYISPKNIEQLIMKFDGAIYNLNKEYK